MKNPLISVVIPVYGVEKYIAEFIETVFSQDYQNVQFIFVNDGTKDKSIEILNATVESKYPHLKERIIIVNKQNGGLPAARKTGMEYVKGDYVCHMDPDDWIETGSFRKMADAIEKTEPDILYYYMVKEYPDRKSIKKDRDYAGDIQRYIKDMFNHRALGSLCNKCVKTSIYRNCDITFPKYNYAEDCYVTSQLAAAAESVTLMKEVVYHYRKSNSGSLSHQKRQGRKREYAMNFLELYEKYRDIPRENNPISCIFDDILLKAGWFSIAFRLNLFASYPYLAKDIRRARPSFSIEVPILAQLLVKAYALFR